MAMNILTSPLVQQIAREAPPPTKVIRFGGQLCYTWRRDEHELELEIASDGRAYWCYQNRRTREILWYWQECEQSIPDAAMERLRLFQEVTV